MTQAIALSYINRSDAATLSGGSWAAALPLANLQTKLLAQVARSTDALAASTQFAADMGSSLKTIGLVALVQHNFSVTASYRIKAGSTPGGSDLYDSGNVDVWPPLFLPGDLEWEDPNWWDGSAASGDIAGYPASVWHIIGSNVIARYWTVAITDTSNPSGYVQTARLWMGNFWRPVHSYEFGAGLQWEPRDVEERSLSGVAYFDERPAARIFSFGLGALSNQEAFGIVIEIQRLAKNSGEVVVLPDSDDLQYSFKRNLLGRLRKADPIKQLSHQHQSAGFEVEEIL